ncbi:MAG: hypothetical protein ACRDQA_25995 [Nocardioidaceae bacterium]
MAVTPDDIAVALGRTAPAVGSSEFEQWSMWIDDARMLIQARLGDLSGLDQDILDYVIREAVVAQVRRPDDATAVDIAVDDGRVSRTYRSSAGRVTIRDEWWDLLSPTGSKSGAFSITPSGSGSDHLPWCALAFGALYCSCGTDIAGYPIFELG